MLSICSKIEKYEHIGNIFESSTCVQDKGVEKGVMKIINMDSLAACKAR